MRILLSLCFTALLFTSVVAQDKIGDANATTERILLITHKSGDKKPRALRQGKVVKLFLDHGATVVKGRFTLDGDHIVVNDQAYKISDIEMLRVSPRATKISGGVLTGLGGGTVLTGTVVTVRSFNNDDACGAFAGLLLTTVGLVPVIIGVPLLLIGKKYDLKDDWMLTATKAQY